MEPNVCELPLSVYVSVVGYLYKMKTNREIDNVAFNNVSLTKN